VNVNDSLEEGELASYDCRRVFLAGHQYLDLFSCCSCRFVAQTQREMTDHTLLHQVSLGNTSNAVFVHFHSVCVAKLEPRHLGGVRAVT
jgi:hypothetical protein